MKTIKRIKKDTLNIVQCEGAACISMNHNDYRYYAQGVSSRMLDVKRYKV
jgi:hypothetical protein|nr:MAG TPA: hypothetical protein [Crassvirales sp.]DAS05419.1 MAG TPA: hypothetical protein [Crassvirales sp.]